MCLALLASMNMCLRPQLLESLYRLHRYEHDATMYTLLIQTHQFVINLVVCLLLKMNLSLSANLSCLQLDINTVAAGGGSRLFFRAGLFVVGPESASAHPGPVCYRKGKI